MGGEELLVGPPDDDDTSIHWGCFVMAPWPGRLAAGRFERAGRTIQLRRTHGRHAIHGLTWNRAWRLDRSGPDEADLSIELPRDEWPMGGRVRQRVALTPTSLRLEAAIEADEPMPAALGWHPWFVRRGDPRLRVDASAALETERMIPTGSTRSVSGRADLRYGTALGNRRLDLTYVGARSPAVVTWPDAELTIEFDPSPAPLVVYSPPACFCVEPMTSWPNAFNGGPERGSRELPAGGELRAATTFTWRSTPDPRLSSRP